MERATKDTKDVSPQICQHYVSLIQTLTACSSNQKSLCLLCFLVAGCALHVTANDVFALLSIPEHEGGTEAMLESWQCFCFGRLNCKISCKAVDRNDTRPLTKPRTLRSFTCFECPILMQYVATVSSDRMILQGSSN